jgi:hypothetical protein
VNHYCTYFDRRYAVPGLALRLSLRRYDPDSILWVLCLDDETAVGLSALDDPGLRMVPLADLEAADPALSVARGSRTWVEYVFTLSPCWPRFLFASHPEIEVLTYVDADMAFFASPAPIFAALGDGHVLIVEHRFPAFLAHLEARGRFNVGVLCFRRSATGRACLDDWRERCLEWCHDRVEPDRFADQKYLDAWPERFPGVVVCDHPGVNLAPWNWLNHRYRFTRGQLLVDGQPLVIFHFARLRPRGARVDSGQLEFGVMPLRLRSWIYGRYLRLLDEARAILAPVAPALTAMPPVARGARRPWRTRLLELVFGPVWWRVGPWLISGRGGLGRFSGRAVMWLRRNVIQRVDA